jgi:hypothetical protein
MPLANRVRHADVILTTIYPVEVTHRLVDQCWSQLKKRVSQWHASNGVGSIEQSWCSNLKNIISGTARDNEFENEALLKYLNHSDNSMSSKESNESLKKLLEDFEAVRPYWTRPSYVICALIYAHAHQFYSNSNQGTIPTATFFHELQLSSSQIDLFQRLFHIIALCYNGIHDMNHILALTMSADEYLLAQILLHP